jgi:hypothetical protein
MLARRESKMKLWMKPTQIPRLICRSLHIGIFLGLWCSSALAQESATVAGDEIVQAGEVAKFTLTLDQAPNFDGGGVNYNIVAPDGTGINTSCNVNRGQKNCEISYSIPAAAPGGTWIVRDLRFYDGLQFHPLACKPLPFKVNANVDLIYPKGAEITVNPSQIQFLRAQSLKLQMKVQELKASLAALDGGTKGTQLTAVLRFSVEEALKSVDESESKFKSLGSSSPEIDYAQVFFADIRLTYQVTLRAIPKTKSTAGTSTFLKPASTGQRQNVEGGYPGLAQVVLRAYEQNELAYDQVVETKSLLFNLDVESNPPGASVSIKRRGDSYKGISHETNTIIPELPLAIWMVRIAKPGYRAEEREHDPFRESNHVVYVELRR